MRNILSFALGIFAFGLFAVPQVTFAALAEPNDLELVGGVYTNDTTPTFRWDAVSGATSYDVALLGDGQIVNIGNQTSTTSSALGDGWYSFTVRAVKPGVASSWASITFEIDTKGPVVPKVATSVSGQQATFRVAARPDEVYTAVSTCQLDFDDVADVVMTKSGENFSASRSGISRGDHRVRAICKDGDGNTTTGAWSDYVIASGAVAPSPTPTSPSTVRPGDRITTSTSRAVYYYGDDGKRHLFPDETTYKTWYATWSGIKTVTTSFMNSLPLGEPVTVHPGDVVVQFASSDDIFAVSEGGILHRYTNEAMLRLDYGTFWQQFLRLLPSTWFSHYRVGTVIDSSSDYDPDRASAEVRDIDDNF